MSFSSDVDKVLIDFEYAWCKLNFSSNVSDQMWPSVPELYLQSITLLVLAHEFLIIFSSRIEHDFDQFTRIFPLVYKDTSLLKIGRNL